MSPHTAASAKPGVGGETARSAGAPGHGGTGGKPGTVDLGVRQADGTRSGAANSAAGGRGGHAGDEDSDERTTWLTEDEMVWGNSQAAPPVLGG